MTKGTAVPGFYLHIAHSNDKEETDIPQPFKGAQPKQPKTRGGGKGKQLEQKPKSPPAQVQEDQYIYDDTNNYYLNQNHKGQPRGCRPYRGQNTGQFFRGQNLHGRGNTIKTLTKANIRAIAIKVIITKVIVVYIITQAEISNRAIIMANLEAEAVVMGEVIIADTVMVGPIIEAITTTNTISIMDL